MKKNPLPAFGWPYRRGSRWAETLSVTRFVRRQESRTQKCLGRPVGKTDQSSDTETQTDFGF